MLPSPPSTTSDLAVTGVSAQWRTGCAAGQKLRNTSVNRLYAANLGRQVLIRVGD